MARHEIVQDFWAAAAETAPAMGMVGTLIGLVGCSVRWTIPRRSDRRWRSRCWRPLRRALRQPCRRADQRPSAPALARGGATAPCAGGAVPRLRRARNPDQAQQGRLMRLALPRTGGPLWLITLADLSLLLVGFFVFLQATAHSRRTNRPRSGEHPGGLWRPQRRTGTRGCGQQRRGAFRPAAARLPASIGGAAAWARDALADPRTYLIVTGYADGGTADRLAGSGLALAGLRAGTVADALGGAVPRPPACRRRRHAGRAPRHPRHFL